MRIITKSFGTVAFYMSTVSFAFAQPVLVSMQPWGSTNDQQAMDEVFGIGNWTLYNDYASADPAAIFTADNKFVYLQGSAGTDLDLASYIAGNESTILDWVSSGGSLLLESAGWNTDITFGPATLDWTEENGPSFSSTGYLTELGQSVFNYFPIEATERQGNYLGHDAVLLVDPDASLYPFIEGVNDAGDTNVIVGGVPYGDGYITMSGLTLFDYHSDSTGGALGADGSSWLLNMIGAFNDAATLAGAVQGGGGGSTDSQPQSVLERVLASANVDNTNILPVTGTFANMAENIAVLNSGGTALLNSIDGSVTNTMQGVTLASASVGESVLAIDQVTVDIGDVSTTVLGAVNTGTTSLGVNSDYNQAIAGASSAVSGKVLQLGGMSDQAALVLNVASNATSVLGTVSNSFMALNGSVGNLSTTVLGAVNTGNISSGVNSITNGIVSGVVGTTGTEG